MTGIKDLLYIYHSNTERFALHIASEVASGERYFFASSIENIASLSSKPRGVVLVGRQKGVIYNSPEEYFRIIKAIKKGDVPIAAVLTEYTYGGGDMLPGKNRQIDFPLIISRKDSINQIGKLLSYFFNQRFSLTG